MDLSSFPSFLFLDMDGVMVTFSEKDAPSPKSRDEYGHLCDPDCVRALEWLIGESGAGIVLSSVWRGRDLRLSYGRLPGQQWCDEPREIRRMWSDRGLPGAIVDCTPRLVIGLPGEAAGFTAPRGLEIDAWQRNHRVDRVPYAIVDDDDDMLLHQRDRLVQTDAAYGLTRARAEAALALLRKPVLWPWEQERLALAASDGRPPEPF